MERGLSLRWGVGLAISAALLFAWVLEASHMLNTKPRYNSDPGIFPVRSFQIRMEEKQFALFEQQMQKFGATFRFDDRSRQSTPNRYDVFFYMLRNEVDLIGGNVMPKGLNSPKGSNSLTNSIGFYPKRDRSPPPVENVNVLVEGLKTFLAPVDGSVITEIMQSRR